MQGTMTTEPMGRTGKYDHRPDQAHRAAEQKARRQERRDRRRAAEQARRHAEQRVERQMGD